MSRDISEIKNARVLRVVVTTKGINSIVFKPHIRIVQSRNSALRIHSCLRLSPLSINVHSCTGKKISKHESASFTCQRAKFSEMECKGCNVLEEDLANIRLQLQESGEMLITR